MTPERYHRVERVYQAALGCAPDRHQAFLTEACNGDEPLRREVESLLAGADQTGSFLEIPPADVAPDVAGQGTTETMVGGKLGPYELKSLLGAGGMGKVYLAEDTRLKRKVALKLLPREYATDAERLHRFRQEARAASPLNHPNILAIYTSEFRQSLHCHGIRGFALHSSPTIPAQSAARCSQA